MLHFFNDIPSSLGEEVVGVLCIGKFSREQIAKLERLKKTLVFVDSDTLNQGHPCVTTDFENSVQSALCYLKEQGCNNIGLLIGQKKQQMQLKSSLILVYVLIGTTVWKRESMTLFLF